MQAAWTQAALYEPPVILGRKLQPLSPLHLLILDSVDSPFISGGKSDIQDLVLAVHTCCLKWETRQNIFPEDDALKAWGTEQAKTDWREELAAFQLYLSESWVIPEKWDAKDGDKCKANGAYHMALFCMRNLNMPEAEAWNCPVARIVCYRECYAEQETGKSDLVSPDERTSIDKLKAENNGG